MGRETDDLMNAAERSCNQLNGQVKDVEAFLDHLRDQYTEIRGLVNGAETVAAVDGVLKKIVESQKTRKLAEQGLGALAKLLPAAERDVKELDSKVLKKAIKARFPGWNQKSLADAQALLRRCQAALETARKKMASSNALLAKQSKLLDEVEQLMRAERIAIPIEEALEAFCATTLDTALKNYARVEKSFLQKQALVGKIQNEVNTRRDWTAEDRDARLRAIDAEAKALEVLQTKELLAVTQLLRAFWDEFDTPAARKCKSPAVQKLLTEATTRQQKMERRINATFNGIGGLQTDLANLRDELALKALAGAEQDKARQAGKKKALKNMEAFEVIAQSAGDVEKTLGEWKKREALMNGVLKTRPPLRSEFVKKLEQIEKELHGDLRVVAESTQQLAAAEKMARNAYRLFQGDDEIEAAWADAQRELAQGRTGITRLSAALAEMQKLLTAVNTAHPR